MSIFESNIRTFLTAAYDGKKKDFSQVNQHFEAVFDKNYVNLNGMTLNYDEIRSIHENCVALNSRVSDIRIKSFHNNKVEFKFRVANSKFNVIIHMKGELKDDKLIKVCQFSCAMTFDNMPAHSSICLSFMLHELYFLFILSNPYQG